MQQVQVRAEGGSGYGYASISRRAEAYHKLRDALIEKDGFIGENLGMTGVPDDIIGRMNMASSHTDVLVVWNEYLVSVVRGGPLH